MAGDDFEITINDDRCDTAELLDAFRNLLNMPFRMLLGIYSVEFDLINIYHLIDMLGSGLF